MFNQFENKEKSMINILDQLKEVVGCVNDILAEQMSLKGSAKFDHIDVKKAIKRIDDIAVQSTLLALNFSDDEVKGKDTDVDMTATMEEFMNLVMRTARMSKYAMSQLMEINRLNEMHNSLSDSKNPMLTVCNN